ncbi:protein Simiate [Tripterygium wilfordii]|uniref:Protein Simiate n=1 Tax=Tripterygium wilfordii TaxID=458696 RepID=A0A7J7DM84_TRIWF|nr:protein Simiate [Tripterygium wilfordii]
MKICASFGCRIFEILLLLRPPPWKLTSSLASLQLLLSPIEPSFKYPDREGYVAIIMPKPADLLKTKGSLLSHEEYKKLRGERLDNWNT